MKFLAFVMAVSAFTSTVHAQHPTRHADTVTVQILAINDLHGNLEPPSGADGMVNGIPAGGVEYLATHLRDATESNPNSILVGAGDLMGASPLLSATFHDEPTVESLNAMHLALTSIGNHEMDNGPVELARRLHGGCLKQDHCKPGAQAEFAHYDYLAANVVSERDPHHTLYPATAVRTIGGVKVGFIGETLESSAQVIAAPAIRGLRFAEESSVANAAAARLERQGVHAIVLLIHQGGFQHPEKGPADINGCANFSGEVKGIVEKLSPAIKLVISAHTHVFYNCQIAGHTLTSAGAYGRMFTRAVLTVDRRTGRIVDLSATNEINSRDVPKDPAQTAILAKYIPEAAKIAGAVVGSVTGDIRRRPNALGESAMGDLIADAELAATSAPANGGAQIAFMNLGGIRAELAQGATATGTRDVTFGDLYAAQPFSNQLAVVSLTGDILRRLLEQQFPVQQLSAKQSTSEGSPQLLQISRGFTYTYRTHADPGHHIVEGSMRLNGKPIAPTDTLRVTASDFVISGNERLTVFREATRVTAGPVDLEALTAYFKAHSPVSPTTQARIVRMD